MHDIDTNTATNLTMTERQKRRHSMKSTKAKQLKKDLFISSWQSHRHHVHSPHESSTGFFDLNAVTYSACLHARNSVATESLPSFYSKVDISFVRTRTCEHCLYVACQLNDYHRLRGTKSFISIFVECYAYNSNHILATPFFKQKKSNDKKKKKIHWNLALRWNNRLSICCLCWPLTLTFLCCY